MRKYAMWFALLLLILYGGATFLIGDFPHNLLFRLGAQERLLPELEGRRSQWENADIVDYRIAVENLGFSPYSVICSAATLEVRGSLVQKIEGAGADAQWCPEVYRQQTIEGLFDVATQYVQRYDPVHFVALNINYDESYGFIRLLKVAVQSNLLDPFIYGDDVFTRVQPIVFEIQITEFEPLKP